MPPFRSDRGFQIKRLPHSPPLPSGLTFLPNNLRVPVLIRRELITQGSIRSVRAAGSRLSGS